MDDKIKITYPSSEKVYMKGKLHPEIKVGMRKVLLTPTVTVEDGKRTVKENDPIYVYDTSGPYSDPNVKIDLKQGLPRMRESWILQRGDVEQLDGLTSEYGRMRQEDKSLDHLRFSHIQRPYRAKAGRQVSQMYYAKQGIITPEMKIHIFGVQPITHRLLLYSTVQYFSLSYSYDLFFIIENMTYE